MKRDTIATPAKRNIKPPEVCGSFSILYWFSPSIFSVCVLHTTKQVSANRLTPFAKSILGLEHIHLFESPRIPLSDQKDFYSIILEATRNTFDSFHLHSYWYFWPHYVDSMARNIMNRELTNRRFRLDDAVGFSDMPTAHACEETYPAASRQIGRRYWDTWSVNMSSLTSQIEVLAIGVRFYLWFNIRIFCLEAFPSNFKATEVFSVTSWKVKHDHLNRSESFVIRPSHELHSTS